ncbi:hypothetical protein GBAR_LOCUS29488 [Geodia barretti]|uniref:Fibronectin type-III domain-containing protein n=1 Tax=Geodia barretti TaxID=519541 RepID=A0AA35TU60_GEOBA|nr:hypothetical protein GBAR_LOCUS29488 [Geodia barretti]
MDQHLVIVRLQSTLHNMLVILLCLFPIPDQPIIFLVGKSPNSLNFTWNVSNTTDAITYTVEWEKTGCLAENRENNGSITTNYTNYSITGLEEGSRYNITVTAEGLTNTVYAVTTLKAPNVTKIFATSYFITTIGSSWCM